MAIRVFIKREVPAEKAQAVKELIDRMRSLATGQPGYVSGETLKRIDQEGQSLVISKWKNKAYWDSWYHSTERVALQEKIDALLDSPTQYEIYDYE